MSERNGDPVDLSDGSGRETDFTVDETSSSGTQPNNEGTTVDQSSSDSDDFVTPIKLFLDSGCGCRYGKNNSSCTISFSLEEFVEHRMQCIQLSPAELHLVLLGALQSHMNLSRNKKRYRMTYYFQGVQVYKETFLFVYCIRKSRLENLKAHLKRYGAVPRRHANTSRLPKNVLEQAVLNRTVTFIKNFATEHGVSLPGRAPSFKDLKVQLLPSSESKASIWRQYKKVSEDSNLTVVSYAKFVTLWNTLTPYIIVMKPASDLCSLC